MADRGRFTATKSIRFRLLVLLLGISAAAMLVISIIAVNTAQSEGLNAQQISGLALRTQAESYLVQLTQDSAKQNDLILDRILNETRNLATYTADIYDHPEAFASENYWRVEDHMSTGPDGQYKNGENDVSSVFVPNMVQVDEQVNRDIQLSAYLDFVTASIFNNTPSIEAIYFGTPREVVRYYPNIDLGSVLPPDFQVSERVWYSGSTLENDPDRKAWWTPVYVDATGLGLVTTAAMPVYDREQRLLGVVGFDVKLNDMKANIEATHYLKSGYSFLIDKTGHAIALPDQGYSDILGQDPNPENISPDLSSTSTDFAPIIQQMMNGQKGFQTIWLHGRELFVAYAPLASTEWSLGSVIEASDVLQAVTALQSELTNTTRSLILGRVLPVSAGIFALVILLGLVLTNRLVRPIQNLAKAAQKIGSGQWDVDIPRTGDDEIGVLAQAFKKMAGELRDLLMQLEQRVAERTQDLERRNTQVQVAAQVARDITTNRGLENLLNHSVNLIRNRFGFYHAGIFLVDDARDYAILRAATGDAGNEMLTNGHRLKVGTTGIVGHVTGSGEPRIALDVGSDAVHFRNPLLPETRSEMALPLRVGDQVIGALDVQSKEPNAFNEDDITVLQIMADQLAVAIENARLMQELQTSLHEMETLYGHYGKQSWEQASQVKPIIGYQFDQKGLSPVAASQTEDGSETSEQPLSIPLEVRGTVIGSLDVWPDKEVFSMQDIELLKAISERLSNVMESARLFEETQARAAREQTINEMTANISRSLDIDTVLRNAVQELGQLPQVVEVSVHVGSPGQTNGKASPD